MSTKNVLVIDNDVLAAITWERLVADNKLVPRVFIGLYELEPVMKGYDADMARISMSPEEFPSVALVADTLGGIQTPVDEIMRVLHSQYTCCIATTITKRQTLSSADFGINRLNIAGWAQRWLAPLHAFASLSASPKKLVVDPKRKVLVINENLDICLSMTELLRKNGFPLHEPLLKVLQVENGTIVGHTTNTEEVRINLPELAIVFVNAPACISRNVGKSPNSISTLIASVKTAGICTVATSQNQAQALPEADFVVDESKREAFIQLWMRAIYPTACKPLSIRN